MNMKRLMAMLLTLILLLQGFLLQGETLVFAAEPKQDELQVVETYGEEISGGEILGEEVDITQHDNCAEEVNITDIPGTLEEQSGQDPLSETDDLDISNTTDQVDINNQSDTENNTEFLAEQEGASDETLRISLSGSQMEEKELLRAHLDEIRDAVAGLDFAEGEILVSAESEEEALRYAEAFRGELLSFCDQLATILVEDVKAAVTESADPESCLPPAWPNYLSSRPETDVDEAAILEESAEKEELLGTEAPEEVAGSDPAGSERLGMVMTYSDPYLQVSNDHYQWHHELLDSNSAWHEGYTGSNVKVAILDTGITAHTELTAKIKGKAYYQVNGTNKGMTKTNNLSDIVDKNGSGTHMAGIIAAVAGNNQGGCGIAPGAELYIGNICDPKTKEASTESLYYALQFARKDWYADIIVVGCTFYGYNKQIDEQVRELYNDGCLIVCAAGDDGSNQLVYPAGYAKAVSVGAVAMDNRPTDTTNNNEKVRYSAPGYNVVATSKASSSAHEMRSGTPQAAACVAGVAAVLLSSGKVTGTGSEKVDHLLALIDRGCKKSAMGRGTPNLAASLNIPASTLPPEPPVSTQPSQTVNAPSLTMKLQSETGTVIYYTLDGSTPAYKADGTIVGNLWTTKSANFIINEEQKKVLLKMIAVDTKNGQASKVATYTYEFKPPVTGITITAENDIRKVVKGGSLQLTGTVKPANAGNPKLRWDVVSNQINPAVGVSVDKNGKVTVSKICNTSIVKSVTIRATATDGSNKQAEIQLAITDPALKPIVKSITPSAKNITVTAGDGTTCVKNLTVAVTLSDGSVAGSPAKYVTWYVKDPAVAAVTQSGDALTVTGKSLGKTTLVGIASDGSKKRTQIGVTVKQYVTKVTVSGPKGNVLQAGKKVTLSAALEPGGKVSSKALLWRVSDWPGKNQGAALNTTGVSVTPKGGTVSTSKKAVPGVYKFAATAADRGTVSSMDYALTVTDKAVTKLELVKDGVVRYEDRIFRVTNIKNAKTQTAFDIRLTGGTASQVAPLSCVKVTNSNPKLVTVTAKDTSKTVTVEAVGTGTGYADITVATTDGSALKKTFRVYVSNPATRLYLSLPNARSKYLAYGSSMKLVPSLVAENGVLDASAKKFRWTSSRPDLLRVHETSGQLTGMSEMGSMPSAQGVTITCETTDGSNLSASYVLVPVGKTVKFETEKLENDGYLITSVCKEAGSYVGSDYKVKVSAAGLGAVVKAESDPTRAKLYLYGQKKGHYLVTVSKMDGSSATVTRKVTVEESVDPVTLETVFTLKLQ